MRTLVSSIAHVLFVVINSIYSVFVNRTARKHGGFVALFDLKASSLLLFTDQAYVQQSSELNQTLPHHDNYSSPVSKELTSNITQRNKMKLILLLVAMTALFSSLALAGGKPSKYAKNPSKNGAGV